MNKKIVHFVARDKFTEGYINWMTNMFPDIQHCFVTRKTNKDLDLYEECKVFYYKKEIDIFKLDEIKRLVTKADRIIISGFFYRTTTEILFLLNVPKIVKNKIFIHFWGGDFYKYRDIKSIREIIEKYIRRKTINSVRAIIMLIEEDYEQIKNILNIEKEYYVAIMPNDPKKNYIFKSEKKVDNTLRILIGNSATKENQHNEIFDVIGKFKEQDIEIICPLSYGDEKYREKVISKGNEVFGKKFKPITKYMDKQSYINLLSNCDIGIFNNNRQQAMGNINLMFELGKKLYIRSDNSMWNKYKKEGFVFYDTTKITDMSFDEFKAQNESDKKENFKAITALNDNSKGVEGWKKVFDN